jgi:hypothetical protein
MMMVMMIPLAFVVGTFLGSATTAAAGGEIRRDREGRRGTFAIRPNRRILFFFFNLATLGFQIALGLFDGLFLLLVGLDQVFDIFSTPVYGLLVGK